MAYLDKQERGFEDDTLRFIAEIEGPALDVADLVESDDAIISEFRKLTTENGREMSVFSI